MFRTLRVNIKQLLNQIISLPCSKLCSAFPLWLQLRSLNSFHATFRVAQHIPLSAHRLLADSWTYKAYFFPRAFSYMVPSVSKLSLAICMIHCIISLKSLRIYIFLPKSFSEHHFCHSNMPVTLYSH